MRRETDIVATAAVAFVAAITIAPQAEAHRHTAAPRPVWQDTSELPRTRSGTRVRDIAAEIKALIAQNAARAETLHYPDQETAVTIVRGGRSPLPAVPGNEFARRAVAGVNVLRGRTAKAPQTPLPPASAGPAAVAVRSPGSGRGQLQIVAFADPREAPVTVLRGRAPVDEPVTASEPGDFGPASGAELDRVAFAVDGAESSHGADPAMWRPDPTGPQGPMQVSAAAAIDSGGGDRYDVEQNRRLGRTYLARLFQRYGNWPDAVAAYNWGPGNLDMWIVQGRPATGLPQEVERYRARVLRDGGFR